MEALDTSSNGSKATSKNGKDSPKTSRQKRHYGALQSSSSSGDMTKASYSGLVDNTPTEWKSLKNYELFSLTPDGLFPWLKASRNKAVRLFDGYVEMVDSGRYYKIVLSSH